MPFRTLAGAVASRNAVRCVLVHSRAYPSRNGRSNGAVRAEDPEEAGRRNQRLVAATSEKAILKSGVEIPCKTIISTVLSTSPAVLQKLDCAKEKGSVLVTTALELTGYRGEVWALEDCAAIRGGKPVLFTFEGLGTLGSLGGCADPG